MFVFRYLFVILATIQLLGCNKKIYKPKTKPIQQQKSIANENTYNEEGKGNKSEVRGTQVTPKAKEEDSLKSPTTVESLKPEKQQSFAPSPRRPKDKQKSKVPEPKKGNKLGPQNSSSIKIDDRTLPNNKPKDKSKDKINAKHRNGKKANKAKFKVVKSKSYQGYQNKRNNRKETKYIILHTTETSKNAINSLNRYGSANFLVEKDGRTIEIVPRRKKSNHAGRSLWNGDEWLNKNSIGVEVEGFHNKAITDKQTDSLRKLLDLLKSEFSVVDSDVLTHSMVAYGKPNRWHRYWHRGRKRCGMIFAERELRLQLNLRSSPESDPEVESDRLQIADRKLFDFLFAATGSLGPLLVDNIVSMVITKHNSAWDISRSLYDDPETVYTFPSGEELTGDEIQDWGSIPEGTEVSYLSCSGGQCESSATPKAKPEESPEFLIIGEDGNMASELVGNAYASKNTIYFIPRGEKYQIFTGRQLLSSKKYSIDALPVGTRLIKNYVYGGKITKTRPAYKIAGSSWDSHKTIYYNTKSYTFVFGDQIDPQLIQPGTILFFKSY